MGDLEAVGGIERNPEAVRSQPPGTRARNQSVPALAATTTGGDKGLVPSLGAVARARSTWPLDRAVVSVIDHVVGEVVVVLATGLPSTTRSMRVPTASVVVPLTTVAPASTGVLMPGASETSAAFAATKAPSDRGLVPLPGAVARAAKRARQAVPGRNL